MASFTLTDLGNRSGEVVEAAFWGPVEITKRGKRKLVLLTAEEFDRMVGRGTRQARRAEDQSGPERDEILAGLDAVAQEQSDG